MFIRKDDKSVTIEVDSHTTIRDMLHACEKGQNSKGGLLFYNVTEISSKDFLDQKVDQIQARGEGFQKAERIQYVFLPKKIIPFFKYDVEQDTLQQLNVYKNMTLWDLYLSLKNDLNNQDGSLVIIPQNNPSKKIIIKGHTVSDVNMTVLQDNQKVEISKNYLEAYLKKTIEELTDNSKEDDSITHLNSNDVMAYISEAQLKNTFTQFHQERNPLEQSKLFKNIIYMGGEEHPWYDSVYRMMNKKQAPVARVNTTWPEQSTYPAAAPQPSIAHQQRPLSDAEKNKEMRMVQDLYDKNPFSKEEAYDALNALENLDPTIKEHSSYSDLRKMSDMWMRHNDYKKWKARGEQLKTVQLQPQVPAASSQPQPMPAQIKTELTEAEKRLSDLEERGQSMRPDQSYIMQPSVLPLQANAEQELKNIENNPLIEPDPDYSELQELYNAPENAINPFRNQQNVPPPNRNQQSQPSIAHQQSPMSDREFNTLVGRINAFISDGDFKNATEKFNILAQALNGMKDRINMYKELRKKVSDLEKALLTQPKDMPKPQPLPSQPVPTQPIAAPQPLVSQASENRKIFQEFDEGYGNIEREIQQKNYDLAAMLLVSMKGEGQKDARYEQNKKILEDHGVQDYW